MKKKNKVVPKEQNVPLPAHTRFVEQWYEGMLVVIKPAPKKEKK